MAVNERVNKAKVTLMNLYWIWEEIKMLPLYAGSLYKENVKFEIYFPYSIHSN